MRRWIIRRKEEFLELVWELGEDQHDEYKLYSSLNRTSKGKPTYFKMNRYELMQFRDKINDALEIR